VGLTWSYPLGRRFGVGISTFATVRSQRTRSLITGEAFQPAGPSGAVTLFDLGYKYNHYGILWKGGVTYEWMGFSLGLTATTPRIKVFGSGESLVNRVVLGQDTDGDGIDDPLFVANVQSDLSATYKSPWSLAGGASYSVGSSTTLHGTLEWFNDMPRYSVMQAEPFVGQSTGDTLTLDITQELGSVVNFGVGVEERFTPGFSMSASFRTDRTALEPGQVTDVSVASWNIFFLTVGTTFTLGGGEFTLGLSYGFGSEDPAEFVQDPDDEIIEPLPDESTIKYRSLRFIMAFSF
jgi:long-subunit fatty acid transport protein